MKQFLAFVRKEIYHISRDKITLVILFLLPIVLLVLLGSAVSTEVRNTPFAVLDLVKNQQSKKLIEKIDANDYFELVDYLNNESGIEKAFQSGKAKMVLVVRDAEIQALLDATNPNEASAVLSYFQGITMQFAEEEMKGSGVILNAVPKINMEVKMLYNPQLKSSYSIVPGMIGMLMMIICALMTSIAVVREKELGTMEILLVSPLKPRTIMFAKSIPYMAVAFLDIIVVLCIAYFAMGVPISGNIFLILLLSLVYIFSALSLGLLFSCLTNTQQTAMIAAGVGLMLPSMLLSGLIFPIDSMPKLLQIVSNIVPARWFIDAIRSVMIKGLGFEAVWKEFVILIFTAFVFMNASIHKFKNRL